MLEMSLTKYERSTLDRGVCAICLKYRRGVCVCVYLEVSALRLQPVIDEALWISGKAQHELSLGLQLIDGLNGLMDL